MKTLPLPQLNNQKTENRSTTDRSGKTLEVHSIFRTIQGEGPFAGDTAVFVRLAGCNLQCPNCDTDYTSQRTVVSVQNLVDEIKRVYSEVKPSNVHRREKPLIVITGGEPFRQNLSYLICVLQQEKYEQIQIETNGTYDLGGSSTGSDWANIDWLGLTLVCSPKTEKVHRVMPQYVDYYKYVLSHDAVCPEDGLPTKVLGKNIRPYRPEQHHMPIYVQPEDNKDPVINKLNVQAVKKSCMTYGYRMGIQLHKLIGVD